MSEAMKFDVEGPTQTRATVTFKNWGDEHGLVIRKEKLEIDAKNFRRIAKLLSASNETGESAIMAQMLMTMADQFQNASCGWDATAEAKHYDRDIKDQYVTKQDVPSGDKPQEGVKQYPP